MSQTTLTTIILLGCLPGILFSADRKVFGETSTSSVESLSRAVKSQVSAVTVYRDRALITRSAQEQLLAGSQTLVLTDLPVSLIDQSVRVTGEAEGKARITDVKVQTVFLDTIPEQRIRQLQDRLKAFRGEQQSLLDKMLVLRSQKDFVDSLRVSSVRSGTATGQRTLPEEWERTLAFIERRLTAIYAEMRATNVALDDVRSKIEAVEREINQSRAYSRKSQKQIVVNVSAERSGTIKLIVSYILMGAGWTPLYDARVSSESKSMQLTYSAQVRQTTNEDWNTIDLTLSTALPSAGGTPPELPPWFVDVLRIQPMPRMGAADRMQTMQAPVATEGLSKMAEVEAVEMETATVESQATSAVFRIPTKATIPSDNNPHKVTIAVENLPIELSYTATPKHSQFSYLTSKSKNTSEYPLLSGVINIFFENSFVASSTLAQVLPGQEFEMGLGVDEGIRLERKLLNRFTEYTGTFSKKTKYIYDILIKVENAKRTKVELVVQDQIPISRNEKIVVEQIEPPVKSMQPDASGKLKWNLSLNPGEKREIKLKFSIEHPSDLNVVGVE